MTFASIANAAFSFALFASIWNISFSISALCASSANKNVITQVMYHLTFHELFVQFATFSFDCLTFLRNASDFYK